MRSFIESFSTESELLLFEDLEELSDELSAEDVVVFDLDFDKKAIHKWLKSLKDQRDEFSVVLLSNLLSSKELQKHQKSKLGADYYFRCPVKEEVIKRTLGIFETAEENAEIEVTADIELPADLPTEDSEEDAPNFPDELQGESESISVNEEHLADKDEVMNQDDEQQEGLTLGSFELEQETDLSSEFPQMEQEQLNDSDEDLDLELPPANPSVGEEADLDLGADATEQDFSDDELSIDVGAPDFESNDDDDLSIDLSSNDEEGLSEGLDLGTELSLVSDDAPDSPDTSDATDFATDLELSDDLDLSSDGQENPSEGLDLDLGLESDAAFEEEGAISMESRDVADSEGDGGDGFTLELDDDLDLTSLGGDESANEDSADQENTDQESALSIEDDDFESLSFDQAQDSDEMDNLFAVEEMPMEESPLSDLQEEQPVEEDLGFQDDSVMSEDALRKLAQIEQILKEDEMKAAGKSPLPDTTGDIDISQLDEDSLLLDQIDSEVDEPDYDPTEQSLIQNTEPLPENDKTLERFEHFQHAEDFTQSETSPQNDNKMPSYSDDQLERLGETIRELREERQLLMDKVTELERKIASENQDFVGLRAILEEKDIEISLIRKRKDKQLFELKDSLDQSEEKRRLLEAKLQKSMGEIESLRRDRNLDMGQIRSRERELENKLELLKADTGTQIRNRDLKILELKRKIDTLEFDMEMIQSKQRQSLDTSAELEDRMEKAIQTLRKAIGELEQEELGIVPSSHKSGKLDV